MRRVLKRLFMFAVAALFALFALVVVMTLVSRLRRPRSAETPLARAVEQGDVAAIKGLVARGEDVNARDGGYTPLMSAARAGSVEVVNALLDAKADPNLRDCAVNGWTALIHAIHKNRNETARALVERGADVNARAGGCAERQIKQGMTPLMYAAMYDNAEMVKFLLARGADPRATNGDDNALSYAVAGGSLGRLADIDRAATHPCPVETVRSLLEAAPDARLNDGILDRVVLYVAQRKCPKMARLLEERAPAETKQTVATQPATRN